MPAAKQTEDWNMKKALCLMLSLVLVLALVACGGSKSNSSSGESGYKFLDEDLGVESYAIGFRKGDDALAEQVNGAVKALVKNGTYVKLEDTLKGFGAIIAGEVDDIPEAAFYNVGTLDDALAKAKTLGV